MTVAGRSASAGSWSYQLNAPSAVIYHAASGYIYIMDSGNRRVQRWIPGAQYGFTVAESSTMSSPRGMRFDSAGNLAIVDHSRHRVISFSITCRKYHDITCHVYHYDFVFS